MKVTIFTANPSGFEHEEKQLQEIASVLHNEQSDKPVYMLTNVLIGNNEIDCLLLTEKGPFLIDCKAYQGKISGCENGNWYVQSYHGGNIDVGKNLFQQAKKQRFAFLDRWKVIAKKHFEKQIPKEQRAYFRVWLYFKPGSKFVDDRFDIDATCWFGVVTRDNLIEEMRRSNIQYRLSELSYEKIINEFGLSIKDAKEVAITIQPEPEPDPERETKPEKDTEIEPEVTPSVGTDTEGKGTPDVKPGKDNEEEKVEDTPSKPVYSSESKISVPVVIQRGPIQITIPVRPKSRLPELLTAVSEAITYMEMGKWDQALNLANYALTIDKYDRDAQDIKYDILYQLKRGEEAEEFIEDILRGE